MGLQVSSKLSLAFIAQIVMVEEPPSPHVYRGPELTQHSASRPRLSPSVFVYVPRRTPPDSSTRAARVVHAPAFTLCLHHPPSVQPVHQLWGHGLGAQTRCSSSPQMHSSPGRVLLPHSHAGVYSRAQQGGTRFPGPTHSAPHSVDSVSDSHAAGGPAASKVGDPFLRVAFSSLRQGLQLFT